MKKGEKEMLSMLKNRIKRGISTTHKDWFSFQCKRLNLDFDITQEKFKNRGIIRKMSKNNSWPVAIMMSGKLIRESEK